MNQMEKIETAISLIPEIADYDHLLIKKIYEICEKQHPDEEEEM